MTRKLLLFLGVALVACLPNTGCFFLNAYDSDPNERTTQLLNQSENLRQAKQEVNRFWMINQASTLSYERLNGYVGP